MGLFRQVVCDFAQMSVQLPRISGKYILLLHPITQAPDGPSGARAFLHAERPEQS